MSVRGLADASGSIGLESLGRFLLRSEAIASSRIEGLQASAQQVAIAELATTEIGPIASITGNARLVANNIVTLRKASGALAVSETISPESFGDLHRALLPDHPQQGLRDRQNWIGGSDWHPIGADFVPPPPAEVPRLVADLADYLTGAVHAPLLQAVLVHAQFETIHPFTDGNGRVGRALIHTVLTRRGLTRAAVLPVSLVLLTRSQEYVAGLTAYRYRPAARFARPVRTRLSCVCCRSFRTSRWRPRNRPSNSLMSPPRPRRPLSTTSPRREFSARRRSTVGPPRIWRGTSSTC